MSSVRYKNDMYSKKPVKWRKEGHIAIVTFQSDDNRLTPAFISSFNMVLDAVEK